MEPSRKRMRYCEHCCQTVTYPVYKKYKEEFYDLKNNHWVVKERTTQEKNWRIPNPSLDVEDDLIIANAVTGSYSLFIIVCSNSKICMYVCDYKFISLSVIHLQI